MHNKEVSKRVAALRNWMNNERVDALIIPTSDPHNSEYTPDYWKCREWLTGFTGSAGTAVVTKDAAALWTDSRYYLQAAEQLEGTPFVLMKDGEQGTPGIAEWLQSVCPVEAVVGIVPEMVSYESYAEWAEEGGLHLLPCDDPFGLIWSDRPRLSKEPVEIQPLEYAGATISEKLSAIRAAFSGEDVNYFLMNDLGEIAWTLNLRGNDVEYNPVFLSYLLVHDGGAILFIDERKVSDEVREYLRQENVKVRGYNDLKRFIADHAESMVAYVFPPSMNYDIIHLADELCLDYGIAPSPAEQLRAVKSQAEVAGYRRAMERDGVAMVRFLRWLDEHVGKGGITEVDVDRQLTAFRAEQPLYRGLSFATIAGYAAHGAIVHYEAEAETAAVLEPRGLLLLDSGAQYEDGTTDITRTIALGPLTEEERKVYTLVLKGHIALSRACFPEGTTGLELDMAARYAMWQEGYDFGHGTGHGVGSRGCVHEGPHQIRKNYRPCTVVPFRAGMTITNEPGIYVSGRFGVRIENVLLTEAGATTDFGRFLRFEVLTLCPIDLRPVVREMLTPAEVDWLNAYHQTVRERLLPLLPCEEDRIWLLKNTVFE